MLAVVVSYSHGIPLATAVAQRGQRLVLESVRNGQWCVRACAQGLLERVTGIGEPDIDTAGMAGQVSILLGSCIGAPHIVSVVEISGGEDWPGAAC